MRLIDKDRLLKGSNHYWLEMENFGDIEAIDVRFIEMAEEVKAIPLDKPFCKMVYGDYVCYNRNWLMKHLPMELDILKGKAIPIEWIEEWGWKNGMSESMSLRVMIEDWEKENE